MTSFAVANQSGLIVNRIVLDDPAFWQAPEGFALIQEGGEAFEIGGSVVGGVYTPPVVSGDPPQAAIPSISDRQFFQQLAVQGIITQADALSAVKIGTIPPALQAIIAGLPQGQQFGAEMLLSGATIFERAHPLTNVIGSVYGMSPEQVDQFFLDAGKL